jgi:hypothetical protein
MYVCSDDAYLNVELSHTRVVVVLSCNILSLSLYYITTNDTTSILYGFRMMIISLYMYVCSDDAYLNVELSHTTGGGGIIL